MLNLPFSMSRVKDFNKQDLQVSGRSLVFNCCLFGVAISHASHFKMSH